MLLERAHVLGDLDVLAHPEGEARHQGPRLGSPEVPIERAVVALAEHLRAEPAAGEDAEAMASPCPRRYSSQQRTKNVPPVGA